MPKKTTSEEKTAVLKLSPTPFRALHLIKETFRDFWSHKKFWARLGVIPFLLWFFASFATSYGMSLGFLPGGKDIFLSEPASGSHGFAFLVWLFAWSYLWVAGARLLFSEEKSSGIQYGLYGKLLLYKILASLILLCSFAVFIIPAGFVFIFGMLGSLNPASLGVVSLLSLVGIVASFYIMGRILLFAPAIVSYRPHPFRVSWHLTKGHVCRFLGGYLLISVIFSIVASVFLGCLTLFARMTPDLWVDMSETSRTLCIAPPSAFFTILTMMLPIIYTSKAFKKLDQLYSLHFPHRTKEEKLS